MGRFCFYGMRGMLTVFMVTQLGLGDKQANLHHSLLGIPMDPNVINNSVNSLFVIIFAPLIGIVWIALARHKREPSSVVKFGLGFFLLGLASPWWPCRRWSGG